MTDTTSNANPVDAPNGHDAAMAAKFDAAQATGQQEQPNAPAAERPAGLPEKFASWEDMAKAYSELEKKQSAPKDDTSTAPETPEAAQAQVEAAGLDFTALSTEFQDNGELSTETYDKLAKAGIPKDTVDAYIAGQEALAQQQIDSVLGEFGGVDAYGQMVQWAASTLSKSEVSAFNKVMDSGDMDSIKLTITGLQAKYTAANGSEPKLVNGGSGETTTDVFRSSAEMTAAMKDPRYSKDPAYRRDVQEKVGRSNIL